MPFPKTLPKQIAERGELVAQIRTEAQFRTSGAEFIIYLAHRNGVFHTFCAYRGARTGRLTGLRSYTANYDHNAAASSVQYHINDVMKNSLHQIADFTIRLDTVEGKEFADRFFAYNPEMKAVRKEQHEASAPKEPEPKPPRIILSRNEWMVRHYPNQVHYV